MDPIVKKSKRDHAQIACKMLITDPHLYLIAIPVVLLTGISRPESPGSSAAWLCRCLHWSSPPLQAAAIMLPILCCIDLFGLGAFRGIYDRRNMPILLTGLAIGIVVGSLIFRFVHQDVLRLLIRRDCDRIRAQQLFGWAKNRPPATASVASRRSLVAAVLRTHQLSRACRLGTPDGLSPAAAARQARVYVGTTVWFFFARQITQRSSPTPFSGQLDTDQLRSISACSCLWCRLVSSWA